MNSSGRRSRALSTVFVETETPGTTADTCALTRSVSWSRSWRRKGRTVSAGMRGPPGLWGVRWRPPCGAVRGEGTSVRAPHATLLPRDGRDRGPGSLRPAQGHRRVLQLATARHNSRVPGPRNPTLRGRPAARVPGRRLHVHRPAPARRRTRGAGETCRGRLVRSSTSRCPASGGVSVRTRDTESGRACGRFRRSVAARRPGTVRVAGPGVERDGGWRPDFVMRPDRRTSPRRGDPAPCSRCRTGVTSRPSPGRARERYVMAKQVTCRTVYEQTPVEDGTRVLVDRVWPQDISEEAARLDEWLSTVAPSAALQRSYSQDPLEYAEFRHRYLAELEDPEHRQAANHLRDLAEHTRLTLLTSVEDPHGGHVAVLAEWLARADPARSDPPSRGFLARVSSAVADLNAGAFAFVMGTGIVSTGLNINGAHTASAVLLVVGLIGCAVLLPAYAWRLLRRRERVVADFVGPRGFSFLTIVIAADVMAARLAPDGHTAAAGAFLAFGAVGWLLLGYGIPLGLIASVRRNPSIDHVNGAWFLWAVGSESVAVAAAALAQQVSGRQLPVLALVCWGIGLVQYLLIAGMVLGRLLTRPVEPRSLMTSSWIFMGAAAITVLAG